MNEFHNHRWAQISRMDLKEEVQPKPLPFYGLCGSKKGGP